MINLNPNIVPVYQFVVIAVRLIKMLVPVYCDDGGDLRGRCRCCNRCYAILIFAAAFHCFATALLFRFLETLKPIVRAELVSEVVEKVMDCIEAWRQIIGSRLPFPALAINNIQ